MQYKTIALEIIQGLTNLHERLKGNRQLLPVMETCAVELKASHEAWKKAISCPHPGREPARIASEALELAIRDLEDHLRSESPPAEAERPTPEAEINRPTTGSPSG